jgi:HK97 family phage prohead protease
MNAISSNMSNRAFSLIECKEFDDGERIFHGLATSPKADRVGDSVDPFGVTVASNIPLLMGHDHNKTVGRAMLGKATAKGIPFEARLPRIAEPGPLKDLVDGAWSSVRYGLITAVSIGFRALEGQVERLKTGGLKFNKVEIMELSLVAIPAHPEALIAGFKSMDAAARSDAILAMLRDAEDQPAFRKGAVYLTPSPSTRRGAVFLIGKGQP